MSQKFHELSVTEQIDAIYAALEVSESVTDASFELEVSWEYFKRKIAKLKINVGDKPWYFSGEFYATFDEYQQAVVVELHSKYNVKLSLINSFLLMDEVGLTYYYQSTASVNQYCKDAFKRYSMVLGSCVDEAEIKEST